MSTVFTETFDGAGTQLSTSNTGFSYVRGAPARSTDTIHGTGSMYCTGTAGPHGQHYLAAGTIGTLYQRFYVKLGVAATGTFYLSQVLAKATPAATLSVQSDSGLRMRVGTSTTIGVASTPLKLSNTEWTRVEWMVTPTTMQLRMFQGANVDGVTPNYDSGAVTWDGTTFNRCGVGNMVSFEASLYVDDYKVDNSAWVGSDYPQEPPTPVVHSRFRFNGTAWAPVEAVRL